MSGPEYVKYILHFDEGFVFDTFDEALSKKKEIAEKIDNGEFDDRLEEGSDLLWPESSETIEGRREIAKRRTIDKRIYTPSGILKNEIMIKDDGKEIDLIRKFLTFDFGYGKDQIVTINLGRQDKEVYVRGGLCCHISPWGYSGVPLELGLCICPDGGILHRGWEWGGDRNPYLHTNEKREDINVTPEMIDTVNGLFSGRYDVDGLKIAVGGTVQGICPINVRAEEKKIGKTIYLA